MEQSGKYFPSGVFMFTHVHPMNWFDVSTINPCDFPNMIPPMIFPPYHHDISPFYHQLA